MDENLLKQKEKIGLEWSQNYTQEHYAKRLLKSIYDFLGKDINLDYNIQSLWIGDKLSNMEILSMKSFLHQHMLPRPLRIIVVIYTRQDVQNLDMKTRRHIT